MRRALTAAVAVLLVAGCGEEDRPADAGRSDRLVDFSKQPPFVNSLEQDEETGELLLTTNRGFFRVDPESGEVEPQKATVSARGQSATLGTFLELDLAEDGSLVGSGHPDLGSALPQYLGYIRSTDGGETWKVVSRLGLADLHKIVFRHDRLYAWDAVLSALLISEDGGRTFSEHFTPRGLVLDFEVDPEDPDRILAATEEQLHRSEDGGDSWRPVLPAEGVRLAWPEPGALYLATGDGRIQVSEDGGDSFDDVGAVDGEPYVLKSTGGEGLLLALSDGTVLESADGGASWEELFRP